jgi:hypothetical protein
MTYRLETAEGKQLYGLRKQTVEPVFGIIKQAIGFRLSTGWSITPSSWNSTARANG